MRPNSIRPWIFALAVAFFLVRYDLWALDDARFVLGLPIGLAYHVAYCLLTIGMLALLVRFAWPAELAAEGTDPAATEGTDPVAAEGTGPSVASGPSPHRREDRR